MKQNMDPGFGIINFLQMDESTGTGGQPSPVQFNDLRQAGYQCVINLVLPTADYALANEGAIVSGLGMTYVHIPVIWEHPAVADFNKFAHIMWAMQDSKIFIHCGKNMRVACFMYLYRTLYEHIAQDAARRDMLKIWKPNETWQSWMDAVHSSHINLQGE